ncbi:MAG TPA: P-loop NTPase fold protein [Flavobacterium sp.]|nr:P-loop NTPase fold protein [Flavobacterium sp.]
MQVSGQIREVNLIMQSNLDTSPVSGDFANFIQPDHNTRIILSAPFGMGKTTFLDQFFHSEVGSEYFTIKIDPVHYSLASNEDIFKLIKYDVLFYLLKDEIIVEMKSEFSASLKLGQYLSLQTEGIVSDLIKIWSDAGKKTLETITLLEDRKTKYMKFASAIEEDIDYKNANAFLTRMKVDVFLLEDDMVSKYIQERIAEISEHKKPVLLIDDLDRLDPAHVFRIFNVFSAHLGWKGEHDNKFGFKKVVFVCDVDNLRSIFATHYGLNTDFNGYIDKFYSTEIFRFEIRNIIVPWMNDILNKKLRHLEFNPVEGAFVSDIVTAWVRYGLMSMRSLSRLPFSSLDRQKERINRHSNIGYVRVHSILKLVAGSNEELNLKYNLLAERTYGQIERGNAPKIFRTINEYAKWLVLPTVNTMFHSIGDEKKFHLPRMTSDRVITYKLKEVDDRIVADSTWTNGSFNQDELLKECIEANNRTEILL